MKSAEEILMQYVGDCKWDSNLDNVPIEKVIEAMKDYSAQVAEETLKMAANGCVFAPSLNEYVNEKSCIEDTIIFLP